MGFDRRFLFVSISDVKVAACVAGRKRNIVKIPFGLVKCKFDLVNRHALAKCAALDKCMSIGPVAGSACISR